MYHEGVGHDRWLFRFAMVVGGEVFLAEVEEKKKALETYNEAVSKGQSAGNNGCASLMKRRHNYALTGKNLFITM